MPSDQSAIWLLKKHGTGNIHGPVPFEKLVTWANSAQINPQDSISNDGKTWTKAPMIEDLGMDWLIEVPDNPLYGPTTAGALLEFLEMGEIAGGTVVIDTRTAESMPLSAAPFYKEDGPSTLMRRIEALEEELRQASVTIATLESRVAELEGGTA